jgi:hypothetical protein
VAAKTSRLAWLQPYQSGEPTDTRLGNGFSKTVVGA